MKREGKQHGMVITYLKPESKLINPLKSPPTAGLFTKVPSKPTNHSKFTGKCGLARCNGCHMHPVSKSKLKTKGYSKVRSDVDTYKMLTWQIAGGSRPDLKLSGFSATGILDLISEDFDYDFGHENCFCHDYVFEEEDYIGGSVVEEIGKLENDEKEEDGCHDDDDERMSFCDVGIMMMMDHVEECDDEGWCLVEETMTY